MRARWLIALVLILALALCGSVVAGPKCPQYGDPDIYEGMRPKGETPRARLLEAESLRVVIIDLPYLGRIFVVQQERDNRQFKVSTRFSAVLGKEFIRR
jgi:hypothetical protein